MTDQDYQYFPIRCGTARGDLSPVRRMASDEVGSLDLHFAPEGLDFYTNGRHWIAIQLEALRALPSLLDLDSPGGLSLASFLDTAAESLPGHPTITLKVPVT